MSVLRSWIAPAVVAAVGVSLLSCATLEATDRHVVTTASGKVMGFRAENGVWAFLGIPYAEPPKGDLRFAAPVAKAPWEGIRSAMEFGASCPQNKDELEPASYLRQDEDCLSLNIWTPAADDKKRPVIIYIPGGGFISGGSGDPAYNGAVFAKRGDVVFVSLNYRVNAFGFLYLDDLGDEYAGSGSNGIRDQLMGIRWVRDTIGAFGGDPENITVMGESAGCISALILMGLPQSRGLFTKVIAESGGCNDLRTREQAAGFTKQFFQIAGVSDAASLRKLTQEQIVDLVARLQAANRTEAEMIFAPVVDGTVIPKDPVEAVREGAARGIALLNGVNHDEYNYFALFNPGLKTMPLETFFTVAPDLKERVNNRKEEVLEFYRNRLKGAEEGGQTLECVTDVMFHVPHMQFSDAQSAYAKVWLYSFDWRSNAQKDLGACHAIELPFVFQNFDSPLAGQIVGPHPPMALSDAMQDAWIAFARAGDPNHAGLPNWPSYDTERRATMIFNTACELKEDPDKEVRQFYQDLLATSR